MYRNKRNFNSEVFSSELEKKLETLNIETQAITRVNFNIVFDRFVDLIVQTVDKHASSKKMSRRQRKLAQKPWITNGILTSIKKKSR